MHLLLQLLATLLTLTALFSLTATFLMVGGYAARVPSGEAAMGLLVPLALCVVGALLLLGATALAVLADALAWIGPRPGAAAMWVVFGAGVGAVTILFAWMERLGGWVLPVGVFVGGVAPWIAAGLLLASLWTPQAVLASPLARWLAGALLCAALLAPGIALALLGDYLAASRANAACAREAHAARAAEDARRQALTPVARRREDYARFSPNTPLWVFVASLPALAAGEERDLVIEYALKVPDFQRQLAATVTTDHPVFRHGAIELLRHAPPAVRTPQWNAWLAQAIAISAQEIARHPDWLVPRRQSNPDPLAHLAAMAAAADSLGRDAQLEAALAELRKALDRLPDDPLRARALAAIGG